MKHDSFPRGLFRKRSIRSVLFLTLVLCTIVPILLLSVINLGGIRRQLAEQQAQTYRAALSQAASYAGDRVRMARNLISMLCADSTIQQGWGFREVSESATDTAWMADVSSGMVVYKGSLQGTLSRVYLFSSGDLPVFRDTSLFASLSASQRQAYDLWLKDSSSTTLDITFPQREGDTLSRYVYLLTKIPSANHLGTYIGMIQANLSMQTFSSILDNIPVSRRTLLYLLDANSDVILSNVRADVSAPSLREVSTIRESAADSSALQTRIGDTLYITGCSPIQGTGWRLVMLVPYSDITAITAAANRLLLLSAFLLMLLMIPVTAFVTRRFTRPMQRLEQGVRAIAAGNRRVQLDRFGILEIDHVIDSFNDMVRKMQQMMDSQYRLGEELKEKDLQLLQEQINPHFLYNTLDMLHWQAREAGLSGMESIIYSLSDFYRLSLGNGEEIVTLEHELRHVNAYVQIQNYRFGNRITLRVDVPEELKSCRIVKIILQPLVENSIQHGIREKEDMSGTILIRACRQADTLVLSVQDDGVGMEAHQLESLLSCSRPGYGVYNVNDRLVLHYGAGAGLTYQSAPGKGTTVTFRIPL